MKIPGAERAVVDPAKVRNYLLSREHPVGSAKARFLAHLGFDAQNWTALRDELHRFASQEAQLGPVTRFGQKYLVHGTRYDNWSLRADGPRRGCLDYPPG